MELENIEVYKEVLNARILDEEGQPTDILQRIAESVAVGARTLPDALDAAWNFALEAMAIKYAQREIMPRDVSELFNLNKTVEELKR